MSIWIRKHETNQILCGGGRLFFRHGVCLSAQVPTVGYPSTKIGYSPPIREYQDCMCDGGGRYWEDVFVMSGGGVPVTTQKEEQDCHHPSLGVCGKRGTRIFARGYE